MRYPMHLLSLAALGVFVGFVAWGAYALVDKSLLFGATDISLLRTRSGCRRGSGPSASWSSSR